MSDAAAEAREIIAAFVTIAEDREWVRDSTEEMYCPSCDLQGRDGDQRGHNPGCRFVETMARARVFLEKKGD